MSKEIVKVKEYPSPETEILNNLRGVDGHPAGLRIANFIHSQPQIIEINVMGLAGEGKTTIISQLMTALSLYGSYNFHLYRFDTFRASAIEKLSQESPELADTINWTSDHWFKHVQLPMLEEGSEMVSPNSNRSIRINEMIYGDMLTGSGEGRMQRIIDNKLASALDPTTGLPVNLNLVIVADPRNFDIAIFIRKLASDRRKKKLKEWFGKHNIDIGNSFDNSPESDELIRRIMGRTAQEIHLRRLLAENRLLINQLAVDGWLDPKTQKRLYLEDFIADIHIPIMGTLQYDIESLYAIEPMRQRSRSNQVEGGDMYQWKRRIAAMRMIFASFGLTGIKTGGEVLYNPLSRERIKMNLANSLIPADYQAVAALGLSYGNV
jgi:hypothetical protein